MNNKAINPAQSAARDHCETTLREYERINRQWMNAVVWSEDAISLKVDMRAASAAHDRAHEMLDDAMTGKV